MTQGIPFLVFLVQCLPPFWGILLGGVFVIFCVFFIFRVIKVVLDAIPFL